VSKGIGKEWFERFGNKDVYPRDEMRVEGVRARTPRYYDRLLKDSRGEDELEMVKERRAARAELRADQMTEERRSAKEEILRIGARKKLRGN